MHLDDYIVDMLTGSFLITHTHPSLSDQDLIQSIVDRLGRFEVSRTVCETTTHVVCGNARRTINILAATAMGCWILSTDWVRVLGCVCTSQLAYTLLASLLTYMCI